MAHKVFKADCLEWMADRETDSVDLVFGSPPYEAARTYGIDFALKGQAWVDWMVPRVQEMARISRGLVALVIEGQTRNYRYSATPALLMADLHRAGLHLRKPAIFHRVGIPGSGGPDWLRNDYEFILCVSQGRKLPWSDNTAMGHPPKWAPGGEMSNRLGNGSRVNQWGRVGGWDKDRHGKVTRRPRPSHVTADKLHTKTKADGSRETQGYRVPVLANPGNVIRLPVGGGQMGSPLAHENEAPFPERLAEFFIRSFCPPGGTVFDPFSGSGTTAAAAIASGRNFLGTDVRESQVGLTRRRIIEAMEKDRTKTKVTT